MEGSTCARTHHKKRKGVSAGSENPNTSIARSTGQEVCVLHVDVIPRPHINVLAESRELQLPSHPRYHPLKLLGVRLQLVCSPLSTSDNMQCKHQHQHLSDTLGHQSGQTDRPVVQVRIPRPPWRHACHLCRLAHQDE